MQVSLSPGSLSSAIGLIGAGVAIVWDDARWVGYALIVAGALVFLFDVRVDHGHLHSSRRRFGWLRGWFGQRAIPLQEAARRVYEVVEQSGFEDIPGTFGVHEPEKKLTHLKYAILQYETPVSGVRPPSSVSLPIPKAEIASLHPVDGKDDLIDLFNPKPIYEHVTVSKADLKDFIQEYLDDLRGETERRRARR